jgi:hypothetical protein
MNKLKQTVAPLALALALLLAGCQTSPAGPTPAPTSDTPIETTTVATALPQASPTPTSGPTVTPTGEPVTEEDLDASLAVARDFVARLSTGDYRAVYGSLLTTEGQQRLADLVLGRLALANPHISFFELLGSQPAGQRIAVDVLWRETFEGQGDIGAQEATVYLARQGDQILVDDVVLGEFTPAATPVPPPLPRAEALTSPAVAGQEMRFRASGFQVGETVLAWLELADGTLLEPLFGATDGEGSVEVAYAGDETVNLPAGRWIWWAQALRDSARNTGITFDVQAAPTAAPTPTTAPTPAPVRPTTAPAATPAPPVPAPTATAAPSTTYGPPTLIWPEPITERSFGSALIVEFIPVAAELAADEFYELTLVGKTEQGTIYNQGRVLGKGDACQGVRNTPCIMLIAEERFMAPFHRSGVDSRGEWYVQVVRQTGADQSTPVSPPSEVRVVTLKSS